LLGNAELRAQVEELVLDLREGRLDRLVQALREGRADRAVELVDRPVGLDPQRLLRHALAGAQARRPVVARPRVDLRDPRHRRQNLASSPAATRNLAAGYPSTSS